MKQLLHVPDGCLKLNSTTKAKEQVQHSTVDDSACG